MARVRELVTQALDRALSKFSGLPHLALSGGLDSCTLAALMHVRVGSFHAWNVWFDYPGASVPEDTLHARILADKLGFRLNEVRVPEEALLGEIESILEMGENENRKFLLEQFYYPYLARAILEHGERHYIHGEASDMLFAGYPFYEKLADDEQFQEAYRHVWSGKFESYGCHRIVQRWGMTQIGPFADLDLLDYVRPLPPEYKVRDRGKSTAQTKRIFRDAFADILPPTLSIRPKGYPWKNNNLWQILMRKFGSPEGWRSYVDEVYRRRLTPPWFEPERPSLRFRWDKLIHSR